jgi:hypothetical protein
MHHLSTGQLPQDEDVRKIIQDVGNKLILDDGVLTMLTNDARRPSRVVLPSSLRETVLNQLHDHDLAAHLGISKTLARVQHRYWWPTLNKDVTNYVKACVSCTTRKASRQQPAGLLQPIEVNAPFDTIAMDVLGPLPESNRGNKYVFVVADLFSKFAFAFALASVMSSNIADILVHHIFCVFGIPSRLISDQGSNFTSHLLREITRLLNVQHNVTSAYHPQSDGQVERFNSTLLSMLSHYVDVDQHNWDDHLAAVTFAYNSAVHASTQETPFFLVFGRDSKMPHDLTQVNMHLLNESAQDYVERLISTLTTAHRLANEHLHQARQVQKFHYDQRHQDVHFNAGDHVWLYTPAVKPGRSVKLAHLWRGPYIIGTRVGLLNYRLRELDGAWLPHPVHVQRLRLVQPQPFDTATDDTSRPAPAQGTDIYEIERVLRVRNVGRKKEALIKWKGYPIDEATWEPLHAVPIAGIRAYERRFAAGM